MSRPPAFPGARVINPCAHVRRGGVMLGAIIALVALMLGVSVIVLASGRDSALRRDRFAGARAEYNADAAAALAIKEIVANSDADADGTVGGISNDANPATGPQLNGGRLNAGAATVSGITTITTDGAVQDSSRASAVQVYKPVTATRPGLFAHIWENTSHQAVSTVNWDATPQKVGWFPNLYYPNASSGGNRLWQGQPTSCNVRFLGKITLGSAGLWRFGADHDDSFQILVNGVSVVLYDSTTACRYDSGTINLAAGTYDFEVQWNDGGGSQCLTLYWQAPAAGSTSVIPISAFTHIPSELYPQIGVTTSATITGSGAAGSLNVRAWDASAGAFASTYLSDEAIIATNATAASSVHLASSASLDGAAQCPPGGSTSTILTTASSGVIDYKAARTKPFVVPNVLVPAGMPATMGPVALSSGTIPFSGTVRVDSLAMSGTATGVISGTTIVYCTGNITMSNTSALQINAGGLLMVFCDGNFTMNDSAKMNDNTKQPNQCYIFMTGATSAVTINTSADMWAHVRNRAGSMTLASGGAAGLNFGGTFLGNSFTASTTGAISLDRGSAASPNGGAMQITSWLEP